MSVAWLLIAMRFVDLVWLIAPTFGAKGLTPLGFFNYAAAVVGIGGIWIGWFFYQLRQRALLPYNDSQVGETLVRGEHLLSFEGY